MTAPAPSGAPSAPAGPSEAPTTVTIVPTSSGPAPSPTSTIPASTPAPTSSVPTSSGPVHYTPPPLPCTDTSCWTDCVAHPRSEWCDLGGPIPSDIPLPTRFDIGTATATSRALYAPLAHTGPEVALLAGAGTLALAVGVLVTWAGRGHGKHRAR